MGEPKQQQQNQTCHTLSNLILASAKFRHFGKGYNMLPNTYRVYLGWFKILR